MKTKVSATMFKDQLTWLKMMLIQKAISVNVKIVAFLLVKETHGKM